MQLVEKKDVKTIVSELEEGIIELMNSDRYMNRGLRVWGKL